VIDALKKDWVIDAPRRTGDWCIEKGPVIDVPKKELVIDA